MTNEANIAIVYPGQGSQSVGMMNNIISLDSEIKKIFDIASEILKYDILYYSYRLDTGYWYKCSTPSFYPSP